MKSYFDMRYPAAGFVVVETARRTSRFVFNAKAGKVQVNISNWDAPTNDMANRALSDLRERYPDKTVEMMEHKR